jgi:hypothetical protein
MATKPKIPPSVQLKEAARRWTKAAATDLKHALKGKSTSKVGRKRKKHSGTSESTKRNLWAKCPADGCYRRVPQLCDHCRKGRAGVTEKHVTACCPGACDRCARCTLLCPGPCSTGDHCEDQCPGHNTKDTRDDGNG